MKKIIKAALVLWLIAHLVNNGYAALAEEAIIRGAKAKKDEAENVMRHFVPDSIGIQEVRQKS